MAITTDRLHAARGAGAPLRDALRPRPRPRAPLRAPGAGAYTPPLHTSSKPSSKPEESRSRAPRRAVLRVQVGPNPNSNPNLTLTPIPTLIWVQVCRHNPREAWYSRERLLCAITWVIEQVRSATAPHTAHPLTSPPLHTLPSLFSHPPLQPITLLDRTFILLCLLLLLLLSPGGRRSMRARAPASSSCYSSTSAASACATSTSSSSSTPSDTCSPTTRSGWASA